MATLNAFSAMYSIFYESDDVKLYAHLPIKSSELYLAKVISSFGMGVTFLMPLLSLFFIAYWQMAGLFVAIIATVIVFGILFTNSTPISGNTFLKINLLPSTACISRTTLALSIVYFIPLPEFQDVTGRAL